jgi:glutamate-1-semialdehyde 2,1-aminomutase
MTQFVISIPFNDVAALEEAVARHRDEAGTVILEPVNYNSGCVLPQPGFLEKLREVTAANDMILFFDEIQSSFKKSAGGAQEDFGVTPDLCTIGKALGGGVPLSAICGCAEILDRFKPEGDVQHSGTFNAHLISILGGLAFCGEVSKPEFYPDLTAKWERFYAALDDAIAHAGVPAVAARHGARFGLLMGIESPPRNYAETLAHRKDAMLAFIREAAERGVYFCDYGGGPCHHGFSTAHTHEQLAEVAQVVEESLTRIKDIFASKA